MNGQWSFELPYPRAPKGLHSNDRCHWRVKAKSTQEVRRLVALLGRSIPPMERCAVQVTWVVGDRRKRDLDGPEPFLKGIFDALGSDRGVSARIVPDDDPAHMVKPRLAIEYVKGCTPFFRVDVTDLSNHFRPDPIDAVVKGRLDD